MKLKTTLVSVNNVLLISVILLSGCQTNNKATDKTDFQTAFDNYKQLNLPIRFNSEQDFELKGITRDSIVAGSVPLGRLFQWDKVYTSIVLSIPVNKVVPHIFTQNESGEIIDKLTMFNTAGKEPGFSSVEDVTILPDRTIIFVDNTETFEFTSDSLGPKEIPGTRKLTVTTKRYKVMDNGKIQKIE